MEERYTYMVYRVYSEEERPDLDKYNNSILYGWTRHKTVLKAFFLQRSKGKYKVRKMYTDDLAYYYSETDLDTDLMIDMCELPFAKTRDKMKLFTTKSELKEFEKRIMREFRTLSELVRRDDGKMRLLELFVNLDEYYGDALYFLGFRPPELDAMFDSASYNGYTDESDIAELRIDEAYDADHPYEELPRIKEPLGLSALEDVSNKILYSVESFIKVLKADM